MNHSVSSLRVPSGKARYHKIGRSLMALLSTKRDARVNLEITDLAALLVSYVRLWKLFFVKTSWHT